MSNVIALRPTQNSEPAPIPESCLVFTNPGILEMGLVKLLGVSVKESDDPIGFFGTGLRYAMATALRLGGSMTIMTGASEDHLAAQIAGIVKTQRSALHIVSA